MIIKTSYFYQIRKFEPYMIPISTAMSDPQWYRPQENKEWFLDKRGIVNGLRYEPLIVQYQGSCGCPCEEKTILHGECPTMKEYRQLLDTIDKDAMMKAFEYCGNYFKKKLNFTEEPIIVLMVYEAIGNPCSERYALQDYFQCGELTL